MKFVRSPEGDRVLKYYDDDGDALRVKVAAKEDVWGDQVVFEVTDYYVIGVSMSIKQARKLAINLLDALEKVK